jgi:tRNA pseudouridine55 synthase
VQDASVSSAELDAVLDRFRGVFAQTPPQVSAKKIAGRPAYEYARKNQSVELKPVEVEVFALDVLDLTGCEARIRVHCTAGTYVRSIAHDVGQALGCGAHLRSLRRSMSGDFKIETARTMEELGALAEAGRFAEVIIPMVRLLPDFPVEMVDSITASQIRNGRAFRVSPFLARKDSKYVKAVNEAGEMIAIGEARLPLVYHPVLVL